MFVYIPSGDSALIIKAGDQISEDIHRTIRKFLMRIEQESINGVVDFIPSYNELMVCYDPLLTDYRELRNKIHRFEKDFGSVSLPKSSVIKIPVLYGGQSGPDLNDVADYCKLTSGDVIKIHTSGRYLVYMLGFTPGFCYLGGMDLMIATPRKQNPRLMIPAGSVGIAGIQTGIYPIESPGGWQIIGNTPLRMFDPGKKPEFLVRAGDFIQFLRVDEEEYNAILKDVNMGVYQVIIEKGS